MPLFGGIDRIGSHSLFLSIMNLISFGYIYSTGKLDDLIGVLKTKEILAYTAFIFFIIVSGAKAINLAEFSIEFFRTFNYYCALIVFLTLFRTKKDTNFLLGFIMFFLTLDLVGYSLQLYNGLPLLSFSANKNIGAFILALKLNILLFFYFRLNNVFYKILIFLVYGYAYFVINAINSKGGILITNFSLLFFLAYFILKLKQNKHQILQIIFPILALVFINLYSNQNFSSTIEKTFVDYTADAGNTSRIRYYRQTLQSFLDNPILGVGHGNWKVASIKYDAKEMKDYIVQYHSHNDFLQVLAETGIFGFIAYLVFFLLIYLKVLRKVNERKNHQILLFLLMALNTYVFDALINFPAGRVFSQLTLIGLITLISINSSDEKQS